MTYNWNKMVEITVPTGTNGWMYSGEVIINGIKVKFPVGTPTTVPEPAAALLNKMIELEREDDLSGAKPNNHYVGNVTVPDGKTLTLQKGAKVVDEAGVLGSASGSAPVVILPETVMTGEDGKFMSDKPPTAYPEVGKNYAVTINGTEYVLPAIDDEGIVSFTDSSTFFIGFASPEMAAEYGAYILMECNADSVTLSIVEATSSGGNAGGGGVAMAKVSCETADMQTFTNVTCDKKYADMKASYDADGLLWCRLTINNTAAGAAANAECPMSALQHDDTFKSIQFTPLGPLSNMGIVVYLNGDDSCSVGLN